ncbi:MAG: LysR family transcriptional regulator [Alphaproteobacteria bacterium]|nr:LysR family transcriptional regulator [Alphaproteobacteria bacterium]
MKVNQLKYFLAIVEAGSLSGAAQNLGVAQPALSQHIANLEQELDVALLERSSRGVSSTSAGDLLYEHARTIVRQIERAETDVRHLGQSPSGEIVVVLAASVSQIVSPPLAKRVAERLPEVNLLIQEGMSINLARLVESGRADLAFVPSGILPSGVESEQILVEDLVLGGAKGSEGDAEGAIDFEAACQFPLVLPSRPHYVRNTLEQAAFDQGLRLNIKAEQDSPRLLPRLVASGYAYSILPQNGFFEDQSLDGIFTRKIVKPDISRSLHILWPKAASQDRLTVEVKSVLREVITALSISGQVRGSLKTV